MLVRTVMLDAKDRKRCGVCEHCTANDCGKCCFCQDKPNFGGRNILKQCCQQRKCKKLRLTSSGKFCICSDIISLLCIIYVLCRSFHFC